ncbi:MAG TPA: hypothetical protein VFP25_07365 [Nitrososphaeraceae archaeon]|nr:hypothetical protein [Nitrososphaeraceae archaeon]
MKYPLSIGLSIMSVFLLTSIIMVNAQTETNMANMTTPTLSNKELSLSIGELIVESKTQSEGMKISNIDKQEFEISWSGNATLQIDIPVWDSGTVWTTLKDDGYWYGKGYGMLIALDNSVAKYTFSTIGKMDNDGKIRNLGSVTFDTNDTGALSLLKNTIGVLADEIDQQGNAITKIWKLER